MLMNHIENMIAAVDYIEANLTQKLDLDMVAGALHYSKYHLHRLFRQTLGMTLHAYQRRRQLTEAAKLLVFSKKPIMEIALLSGYESQQAFTKIFAAMYKQAPHQYRENERFYPLQLKFEWKGGPSMPDQKAGVQWAIAFASEADIPSWMGLVRLVIDGFPQLHEEEHIGVLKERIKAKQALIMKLGGAAIGIMLFSCQNKSIDFMGIHPLYRKNGIPAAFLDKLMGELLQGKEVSITTYRDGDKADTGQRKQIMELGFAEAELLTEFGYPTQRFVLSKGGRQ